MAELIILQTDTYVFNGFLRVLKELDGQKRLNLTHVQEAGLTDIQSDDKDESRNIMFGGGKKSPEAAFAQTAGPIVRYCMLEATGVPRGLWPKVGHNKKSGPRNKRKLKLQQTYPRLQKGRGRSFRLVTNGQKSTAMKYWSKFDQFYPHFLIEKNALDKTKANRELFKKMQINKQIQEDGSQKEKVRGFRMDNVMFIIRNHFSEVITITSCFEAKLDPYFTTEQQTESKLELLQLDRFRSKVVVECSVRSIKRGKDGIHMEQLKSLLSNWRIPRNYFEKLREHVVDSSEGGKPQKGHAQRERKRQEESLSVLFKKVNLDPPKPVHKPK